MAGYLDEWMDAVRKETAEKTTKERNIEMARDLLKMGLLSLAQVAEASKLPLETVEELAKQAPVAV